MLRAGTPEKIDTDPIGTGPFAFVGYQKDVAVRYRAFPRTTGAGPQPIDTLVFSITPNPAVRLTKLKSGECHVMAFPNPADAREDRGRSRAEAATSRKSLNVGYLALNTTRKPFDDVRVRRAINMAIDKAVYRRGGLSGRRRRREESDSADALVLQPRRSRTTPSTAAAAQRLLVEAGYPEGFETDLWYMPVSRPYNPNGKRVAEMIQADLAKIGIRAQARHGRVERVPHAAAGRRAVDGALRLDRRQRRPRQFPRRSARLHRGAGRRQQHRALVRSRLRRPRRRARS